ncbi:MAG: IgGFc-binding protein, partial [Bacteroidia bacterium]|nr:IgGFc-binding protein [Bacteroidia bacterium]
MLFSSIGVTSLAQVKYTTEGKDFWVAFLQNYGKDDPAIEPFDLPHPDLELRVFVSSRKATRGTISIPNTSWFEDFTVNANDIKEIRVPIPDAYLWGSGVKKQAGVHITTEDSVVVFALNRIPFTGDAAIILPTHALRDEYRVIAYREIPGYLLNNGITPPLPTWFSEFGILAVRDSTEIIITPTAPTRCGKPANQPFTITLNRGEVYQLQSRGDLTGTSIVAANRTSCNVFAVFGGNVCTSVGNCAACDHVYEQIFPTRWYGKQYVLIGVDQKIYDRYRFIADSNNTKITLYEAKQGGIVEVQEKVLNRGEFWQVDLITLNRGLSSFVQGDKPFALMQYGTGSRCDPGNIKYDPFMLMHYPLDTLLQTEVTVPAFRLSSEPNDFWNHYANIVTKTDNVNNISITPAPSSASPWRQVTAKPEYSWRVVRFNNPGFYTIRSADPKKGFSAYIYGSKRDESYGYMGAMAFQFPPLLNSTLDSIVQTGCAGMQDASAKVSVLSGEPPFTIQYTWRNDSTIINGFSYKIRNIPPGSHTVIVKDLRGCINRLPLNVAPPPGGGVGGGGGGGGWGGGWWGGRGGGGVG